MRIPFLSNRFEARAIPISDRVKAFLLGEDLNISNKAGVIVNEETAMRTSAVYACVRVIAEKGNIEFVEIASIGKQVSIGGTTGAAKYYLVKITSSMLASKEFDRVVLKTTAVASSTVVGAIYAISNKPRFSE